MTRSYTRVEQSPRDQTLAFRMVLLSRAVSMSVWALASALAWWSFSSESSCWMSWKSLAMLGPGCSWTLSGLGMLRAGTELGLMSLRC